MEQMNDMWGFISEVENLNTHFKVSVPDFKIDINNAS
jgi:hypothetical protein